MLYRSFVLAGIILVAAGTCMAQDNSAKGIVTGTVTYRQRIALPPDASIKVSLQDVSRMDAAAIVICETEISAGGKQVPIPFELKYKPDGIDPARRYSVRATISVEGKLMFTSTRSYPVLTQGAPRDVEILLQQVSGDQSAAQGASQGASAEKAVPLEETRWNLTELNGKPVVAGAGEREAYIELHADGDKLGGSGGCNRLFGSYDLSGSSLSFHSVASTLMACPDSATADESALLQALKLTDSFRISGQNLELRASERVLARFQARQ